MTDILEAFDRLLALIESDHVEYNLFSEYHGGHTCELGNWAREPGEKDVTVSASGDTPAEAIQGAIEKWETGEQYKPQPGHHVLVRDGDRLLNFWHFGDQDECPDCKRAERGES